MEIVHMNSKIQPIRQIATSRLMNSRLSNGSKVTISLVINKPDHDQVGKCGNHEFQLDTLEKACKCNFPIAPGSLGRKFSVALLTGTTPLTLRARRTR